MNKRKLSNHIFKKGKFITPLNSAMGDKLKTTCWALDSLPEYLWIALILEKYERKIALIKLSYILTKLSELNKNLSSPTFSSLLTLTNEKQIIFFKYLIFITTEDILSPLTLLYTYSDYPVFSKHFCNPNINLYKRQQILNEVLKKNYHNQSNSATDIQFLIQYFSLIQEQLKIPPSELNLLIEYPNLDHNDEKMHRIRPSIRASHLACTCINSNEINKDFVNDFWRRISIMSECELSYIKYPEESDYAGKYIELTHEIFEYLSNLFIAINPLDKKMMVLLGISTYSYKRLIEIVEHNLFNTIIARSTVRTIIENYIMMKYLLKNEDSNKDIWTEFQIYGIGQLKTIVARSRESQKDLSTSHVNYEYLDSLINENINEDFIDMDTSYFAKQNIRNKADFVNEKELFGLYYDYDSSYEHGLWGAIRESSFIKCSCPAHQFHCVPDYKNHQNLPSVWIDCVTVMNKMILLLNETYEIPSSLLEEVKNVEKQLSQNSNQETSK